jgi:hypothetical protein
LLFAFHAGGYLVVFNWQQNLVREEINEQMLKGVPDKELILIKIPFKIQYEDPSVFKWIHDKEFRYQGQLYDIVRSEQVGKTTWFYCIHDKHETMLVSSLNKLKKKDGNNSPLEKNKIQVLKNLVLSPYDINHGKKNFKNIFTTEILSAYFFNLKLWNVEPLSPPPKV